MHTLEERIGYHFTDKSLLELALIHPSTNMAANNQRLEFLGDAVLGMIVAKILYTLYPEEAEGSLARRHAALVCGETITTVARVLELGKVINFGNSELQAEGYNNDSNLEDALEALIGAIYLDGGTEAVEAFVTPHWEVLAGKVDSPPKDAKSTLQEWVQGQGLPLPHYQLIGSVGPSHAPVFTIEVSVKGYPPVRAEGISKRATEQQAAQLMLKELQA